jgi:hypothetical protein
MSDGYRIVLIQWAYMHAGEERGGGLEIDFLLTYLMNDALTVMLFIVLIDFQT